VSAQELAETMEWSTFSGSAFMASITFTSTQLNGAANGGALIGTANFGGRSSTRDVAGHVDENTYGDAAKYVNNQVSGGIKQRQESCR